MKAIDGALVWLNFRNTLAVLLPILTYFIIIVCYLVKCLKCNSSHEKIEFVSKQFFFHKIVPLPSIGIYDQTLILGVR